LFCSGDYSLKSAFTLNRRTLTRLRAQGGDNYLHTARNLTKAQVYRIESPAHAGQWVVVKDLKPCPLWFRLLAGRALLRREWRALQALQTIDGVPAGLCRPDSDSIVMEWRPGRDAMDFEDGEISPQTLEKIVEVLAQAHRCGVTHGDLHRDNILIDEEEGVTIIDWATACVFGPQRSRLKNWTWHEWQALDLRSLAKLKARHAPQLLAEPERDLLQNGGSPLYRLVRKTGNRLRQWLRRGKKNLDGSPQNSGELSQPS
jgi:hypothetical protein